MAFTYVVTDQKVADNEREIRGTYTNDGGSIGGEIVTGLNGEVRYFDMQPKGSAVVASAAVVNETFPLINATGSVTVVTTADEVGYWRAIGI